MRVYVYINIYYFLIFFAFSCAILACVLRCSRRLRHSTAICRLLTHLESAEGSHRRSCRMLLTKINTKKNCKILKTVKRKRNKFLWHVPRRFLSVKCMQPERRWTLLSPRFSVFRLLAAFTVSIRGATVTAHVSRDSGCHFELVNFLFFNKKVHDFTTFQFAFAFRGANKFEFCYF